VKSSLVSPSVSISWLPKKSELLSGKNTHATLTSGYKSVISSHSFSYRPGKDAMNQPAPLMIRPGKSMLLPARFVESCLATLERLVKLVR